MTDRQTVKALFKETERLYQIAIKALREAEAKNREYRAAALEWYKVEQKERDDN